MKKLEQIEQLVMDQASGFKDFLAEVGKSIEWFEKQSGILPPVDEPQERTAAAVMRSPR